MSSTAASSPWPLVGLALGSTLAVVGAAQLSAVWLAGKGHPSRERWIAGLLGAGLVGAGAITTALSSYKLAEARALPEPQATK